MSPRKVTVLVVDDDPYILRMTRRIIDLAGYNVIAVNNGKAALEEIYENPPDLVLLDIMMPGMDGYTVCQQIREFSQIPIIMVTARDSDVDKVQGLDTGADDYITKPFSTKELTARVKAVLRRSNIVHDTSLPALHCNGLTIDFARRRVMVDSKDVELTATEYSLLSYMGVNADRIVTPDNILVNVWGGDYLGETHLLQVTMARLRQKLGDDFKNPQYIVTKPGMGYMLMKQAS